jgi:uncharacterized membrane-anchored protein
LRYLTTKETSVTRIHTPLALAIACLLALGGTLSAEPNQRIPIPMKSGPTTGTLGTTATLVVPAKYKFVEQKDMRTLNEMFQNPHNPNDLGALMPEDESWVIYFSFAAEGKVPDDEKDKLDADAILSGIREGTAEQNKERKRRGWAEFNIVGWELKPFFDDETKNLTWAIRGESQGTQNINYEARVLGRRGYMSVTLVLEPDQLQAARPEFNRLLKGFSYNTGEKYADWQPGDKVATYGLAALAGGVGVAALAKSGLLGKLIKPIIIGVVAIFGAIGAFFKKLFGRKEATE